MICTLDSVVVHNDMSGDVMPRWVEVCDDVEVVVRNISLHGICSNLFCHSAFSLSRHACLFSVSDINMIELIHCVNRLKNIILFVSNIA